jgi:hypothetical protein
VKSSAFSAPLDSDDFFIVRRHCKQPASHVEHASAAMDTDTNVADKEDKVQPNKAEVTKQDQHNNEAAKEIVATDDKDEAADKDKGANNDKVVDMDEEETEADKQEDEEGKQQEDNQDKKKQDKKGAKSKKISAVSQRTEFGPVSIH